MDTLWNIINNQKQMSKRKIQIVIDLSHFLLYVLNACNVVYMQFCPVTKVSETQCYQIDKWTLISGIILMTK